jgi:hypothetical protein
LGSFWLSSTNEKNRSRVRQIIKNVSQLGLNFTFEEKEDSMTKILLVAVIPILVLFSCSGDDTAQNQSATETETALSETIEEAARVVVGFESIESITASFLECLSNRDFEDYLNHVITNEIERELSAMIHNEEKRQQFIDEFGFSLKNEQESFEDLLKYLDGKGLDPSTASHEDSEIMDYEHDHYAPLGLKEVIIPFPYESYEVDIVITCVEYKGSWLLTSEIGL